MSGKAAMHGLIRHASYGLGMLLLVSFVPTEARADLSFVEPVFDAGAVRAGIPLDHRFIFRNVGPNSVEILEARGSCGCLTPEIGKRVVLPGETGELILRVNTLGQAAGPHRWRVKLSYRDANTTFTFALQLTARVMTEISVQPASLTIFAGAAVSQDIVVTDLRPKGLKVTQVQTSTPYLHAELVNDSGDSAAVRAQRVRLQLAPDCPVGRHDEIVVLLTDDPEYRELKVHVSVIKQSQERLAISPPQVSLEVLDGQQSASRLVLVRDTAGHPVVLDTVECDDPAISCRWAQGPGGITTLRVSVERAQANSSGDTALRVHVRQPVRETILVPVSVAIR